MPDEPIMTVAECLAICERQRLGSIPGTPEFEARIAALDAEDPFFAHCVRADAERAHAARFLTPERPADATPAPVRRGRLSEHPCDRCKQHEVYVRQDSNDDADYTIHCYGCGHHYRVDGPDA